MYRKNTASQYIYFVLVNASSGAALTGATVTAYRALDGGSQASATGTTTELANGQYRFNLSQADTNADYGSYLFTATSAVPVEKTVVFTGADVTAAALGAALASNYTATRAGYLDGVLLASNYNQRTVQVTGSNHVAADVHEFQPGVITAGDFASGAITSTVLATDSITSSQIAASAVTEIQSGLATTTQLTTVESKVDAIDDYVDTEVAAIKAKTDNLPSDPADASDITAAFTEIKGAGWSSSTDTLEKIRDASGGGGDSIIVTPVVAQVPVRATATTISTFKGDRSAITVGVFDELDPVDLSSLGALEVCIQTKAGTDLQVIAAGSITISGADSNYFSFSPGSAAVATVGRFMWSLRVAASNSKRVIAYGAWIVEDAALSDV
jgi:hypothetical protein